MVKLADTLDLGSSAERRGGSSPSSGIFKISEFGILNSVFRIPNSEYRIPTKRNSAHFP